MLNNEGTVVAVRGDSFPRGYEVVQERYMISSFFDSQIGDTRDGYIQELYRQIDAWEALNRGLAGDPRIAVGIAPSEMITSPEFARLQISGVVRQALRGQGRPDVWLVAARAEPGRGKLVLDGAIAEDNVRKARWMEISQGTQQAAFARNGVLVLR